MNISTNAFRSAILLLRVFLIFCKYTVNDGMAWYGITFVQTCAQGNLDEGFHVLG